MAAQGCCATAQSSREQIREYLSGNYCRCTGYQAIVDAIEAVAKARASSSNELLSRGRSPRDLCGTACNGDPSLRPDDKGESIAMTSSTTPRKRSTRRAEQLRRALGDEAQRPAPHARPRPYVDNIAAAAPWRTSRTCLAPRAAEDP